MDASERKADERSDRDALRERMWEQIADVRDAAPRTTDDADSWDIVDALTLGGCVGDALDAAEARADRAEQQVARVEALADKWIGMGILRSMEGTVSAKRGRDLRAALSPTQTEGEGERG